MRILHFLSRPRRKAQNDLGVTPVVIEQGGAFRLVRHDYHARMSFCRAPVRAQSSGTELAPKGASLRAHARFLNFLNFLILKNSHCSPVIVSQQFSGVNVAKKTQTMAEKTWNYGRKDVKLWQKRRETMAEKTWNYGKKDVIYGRLNFAIFYNSIVTRPQVRRGFYEEV